MKGKRENFTAEELEWLASNHSRFTWKALSWAMNESFGSNHTSESIRWQCRHMGLPSKKTRFEYTDEQDRWLDSHAMEYRGRVGELTEEFNRVFGENRTKAGIAGRMKRCYIFVYKFTPEQKQWIADHDYMPLADMTRVFNRTFGDNRGARSVEGVLYRSGKTITGRRRNGE